MSLSNILATFENDFVLFNHLQSQPSIKGNVGKITSDENQKLIDAHQNIYRYQYYKRKIDEVRLNIRSFQEAIPTYELKLIEANEDKRIEIQKTSYLDFNRHINNLTSSLKTFVEDFLLQRNLVKLYGKDSIQWKSFKAQTSSWYNNTLGYKFLIRLRDFATHYDFPLFKVDYKYTFEPQNIAITCTPLFNKQHLLNNSKFKSKLEADLTLYNETFPALPIVESILPILDEMIEILLSFEKEDFKRDAEFALKYYNKFPNPKDVSFGLVNSSLELDSQMIENKLATEILDLLK